ncbi:peptidylprolyl isomerase [Deinococcus altitudinis]|uniref:peptidylprolyl isomerase n=1 Tax=Deinococcus altitudinis TaxID=468914 RepID=UPI0038924F9F
MKTAAASPLLLASLLTLSLAACKKDTPATTDTTKTPDTAAATTAKPATATAVTTPGAVPSGYTLVPAVSSKPVYKFASEPARTLKDGVDYYALIDTSKGQILADLYETRTPVTVNNFVTLARNHFYDGILFHRVLDGFMGQTGDPNTLDASKKASWGQGGPGYSFPDEIRQNLKFDAPGDLAMANSGANTNGSQFFITFAPASFLDGKYNLFGKVVQGQDVLAKLTRTANPDQSSGQEVPIEGATPDKILSVRIVSKNK